MVRKNKQRDGTGEEESYLVKSHILGHSLSSNYLRAEDWLEIIGSLIENSLPILKETICTKTIDELIFTRHLQRVDLELDLNVETAGWEKFLDRRLTYLGVKYGAIGSAEISPVKGDVFSQAQLILAESGQMYLFFVRLVRVKKPNSRDDNATVRECHVISKTNDWPKFEKSFKSLAAANPDFCPSIVRSGFDPVYLKLGGKEREFKMLMKFKETWERAVCQ
ncbi:MAG TPA: hypothetical protein VMC41_03710 [Candidatus Nanoarchaeia archaeon]|nr:hypothetical protein [Candidatus Nanoarchaeia archaeon]